MLDLSFPGPGVGVSLHNHSNWSDGALPLEDLCRAAKSAGIRVFGISDHWVLPPIPNMDSEEWSMRLDRIGNYSDDALRVRSLLQDSSFQFLLGLEVDYFHENHIQVAERLSKYPFDYLIGSVHSSGEFSIDHDIADWEGLPQSKIDSIWDVYWSKMQGNAKWDFVQIIGHFDLPKKFGYKPSRDQFDRAVSVLETIRDNGKAIELNTAGWSKECHEQYPSLRLLKVACQMKIPVVVSADAHYAEHLTRNFDRAIQTLREAGYPL